MVGLHLSIAITIGNLKYLKVNHYKIIFSINGMKKINRLIFLGTCIICSLFFLFHLQQLNPIVVGFTVYF